jgi:hypothetical protein
MRFLANFFGGMLAAIGLILIYVYLLGAPGLPRLPIIGLPHTYVALVLILFWAFIQGYLSILGVVADALLSMIGWRRTPGLRMAFWHGFFASAALLVLAYFDRPVGLSLKVALLVPMGFQTGIRLVAGRAPEERR